MLSKELNQRMCRVGPEAPMGLAMRRYWLPFMLAAGLKVGDEPQGVELLGERFVAWRDEAGRPGLYAEACLHRGSSMRLARAEGDGLRCIYHGWKFAVDGKVLETPNVADPRFKERIKGRTFPVREAGGLLWAYLGPRDKEPAFPHWPWMDLPESNRLLTVHLEECSFVQVIEGLVDSSHLGLLHMNGLKASGDVDLSFAQKVNSMQRNLAPQLEVEDTEFGFYYAAVRDIGDAGHPSTEARVAAFVAPCLVLNPNGDIATFVVPMADQRTAFIHVFWSETEALNEEPLRSRHLKFIGLAPEVLDAFGLTVTTLGLADRPNAANNFHQDREAMRHRGSWSGLPGLIEEDVAASVSAGPVRDRTAEMLCASDVGVSRLYRALLACAEAVEKGQDPLGIARDVDWSTVAGTHGAIDGRAWRDLLPVQTTVSEAAV
jgi:phthalate 4,5-dioxygenase